MPASNVSRCRALAASLLLLMGNGCALHAPPTVQRVPEANAAPQTVQASQSRPVAPPLPPARTHAPAQVGKASVYSRRFAGREMADGAPMDPQDDNAASKTLPLGTRARVTNLENGRSATVTVEDRGPYVKGRIIDLSPATAQRLGISRKQGVARVKVTPLSGPTAPMAESEEGGSGAAGLH